MGSAASSPKKDVSLTSDDHINTSPTASTSIKSMSTSDPHTIASTSHGRAVSSRKKVSRPSKSKSKSKRAKTICEDAKTTCKDADGPGFIEMQHLSAYQAAVNDGHKALRSLEAAWEEFDPLLPETQYELLRPYCDAVRQREEYVVKTKSLVDSDCQRIRENLSRAADDELPTYAQVTGSVGGGYVEHFKAVKKAESLETWLRVRWKTLHEQWSMLGKACPPRSNPSSDTRASTAAEAVFESSQHDTMAKETAQRSEESSKEKAVPLPFLLGRYRSTENSLIEDQSHPNLKR